MKEGDIVNIKKYPDGYWKGKITQISYQYSEKIVYTTPLATVIGEHGEHAIINKNQVEIKDGEYWQFKR